MLENNIFYSEKNLSVQLIRLKKSVFVSLGITASDKILSYIDQLATKYKFSVTRSDRFSVDKMIDTIDNSLFNICGASVTVMRSMEKKFNCSTILSRKRPITL